MLSHQIARKASSCLHILRRQLTTEAGTESLRRSYLYVPSSSSRMLEKSLSAKADVTIYDLEDSVSPNAKDKVDARNRLQAFLKRTDLPKSHRVAVRVNDITTPFFREDIAQIASSSAIGTLILPKIHSARDIDVVSQAIQEGGRKTSLNIVPSIESARGLWNLGSISSWRSTYVNTNGAGGRISALLFAAEDYCADTSIIRTPSRRELLYTRSQIVIAAKTFGLEAIDMVCVNYKDIEYLTDECRDGRQLGFTGKQAIHPSQIDVINSTFVPSDAEILRAAKIVHAMELAHTNAKGAVGLEGEMIDAPMIKQAEKIIRIAKSAGLAIPNVAQ